MEHNLEVKDLGPHGYPGYSIREDGWLFNTLKQRTIRGNQNGMVRLPLHHGQGSEWRSMAWLVATAFVEQRPGCVHLGFKDGNPKNFHSRNLEWLAAPRSRSKKRAGVLKALNEGIEPKQVAKALGMTTQQVRNIAADRLRELQMPENSPN